MEKDKDKENKIEETKGSKKLSIDKSIGQKEDEMN